MGKTEQRQYAETITSLFDDKPKRGSRSPKPVADHAAGRQSAIIFFPALMQAAG